MKKTLVVMVAVLMLFSLMMSASAEAAGSFSLSSVSGKAGDTVSVTVSISNNPGIVSFKVGLAYDTSALKLVSVSNGVFSGISYGDTNSSPFYMNWVDSIHPDNSTNGAIATLTFKILDEAPVGSSALALSFDPNDVYNYEFDNVSFVASGGSVNVVCPHAEKTNVPAKSADCLNPGNTSYYLCNKCGCVLDADGNPSSADAVTIPALGHNMGTEWVSENGKHFHKCSRCGQLADEAVCSGGTASCVEKAKCSVCGAAYGELAEHSFSAEWTKGDATGHYHVCTVCGQHDTPVAHTPDHEEASEDYDVLCSVCGYVITPKLNHVHTLTPVSSIAPGCETAGQKAYYHCNKCGKNFEDADGIKEILSLDSLVIPATGHNMTDATCTAPKTCTVCGAVEGTALGHNMGTEWVSENGKHFHKCSRCGQLADEAVCSGGTASCVEKAKCSVCGAAYGELAEHSFSAEWSKGDATGHYHVCTVCGQHDTPVAHTPDHEEASEDYDVLCSVCGYVIEPKLTHVHDNVLIPGVAADCEHNGQIDYYECSKCHKMYADAEGLNEILSIDDTVIPAGHDWKDADCENPKTCISCGETEGEALGHEEAEAWTADENSHWHACTRCEYVFEDTKAEHTVELCGKVDATDKSAGYTGDEVCSVCGKVIKQGSVIPKLGPQTGDSAPIELMTAISLVALSGLLICALILIKRKKADSRS